MAEAAPGTEWRQHMVSLSTRWYAVSPPVPSVPARPQLRASRWWERQHKARTSPVIQPGKG